MKLLKDFGGFSAKKNHALIKGLIIISIAVINNVFDSNVICFFAEYSIQEFSDISHGKALLPPYYFVLFHLSLDVFEHFLMTLLFSLLSLFLITLNLNRIDSIKIL